MSLNLCYILHARKEVPWMSRTSFLSREAKGAGCDSCTINPMTIFPVPVFEKKSGPYLVFLS